jgi:O-acetylhomoserine (thiol)-lyase
MRFNTSLLHAGVQKEANGSTLPPVYQTSAFEQTSATDLEKIFENKAPGFCYTRVGNPTVTAFENRITKLEGGIASIACASGMAALMNAFLNILRSGNEIVSSASLYGGTIDLFTDLEAFGITTRYVENNNWEQIEGAINEHTRLVFAETIGNPCLDVTDIEKLAEIAHAHELPLIVDNTTSTPYLIQVLKYGADIVVNSSSKYINGSSNSISGVLTDGGKFKWKKEKYPGLADYLKFGPMAFIAKLRNGLFRNTGACLAPVNAYLNVIGLETLGLRMERQCNNAAALAKWIEETYPDVTVNYPGLESSPWHVIAKKQFENGYGAILTLRVGSKKQAFDFIDSLNIAYTLSNIGDTKTLVIHPGSTISLHSTEKQKEDAGVFEDLIRVSVGIEDIEDLKEDFARAFAKILGEKR